MKLVIFDLDQTLVNFLSVHEKVTRRLFKRFFNKELRCHRFESCTACYFIDVVEEIESVIVSYWPLLRGHISKYVHGFVLAASGRTYPITKLCVSYPCTTILLSCRITFSLSLLILCTAPRCQRGTRGTQLARWRSQTACQNW
jgi:hypothetical protein